MHFSYEAYEDSIAERAEKMAGLKHQVVPCVAPLSLDTIISYWALMRVGATPLLISPYLPPLEAQKLLLEYRGLPGMPNHVLLSTSGSTGAPKLACISEEALIANALDVNAYLNLTAEDRWGLNLPLFHVGGLSILYRCKLSGASVVTEDPTHISLVPTQLYRQLDELAELKVVLVGGAPISPALSQLASTRKIKVMESYGMTEMASTIAIDGTILPESDVLIDGEGVICVRGPKLFRGYWDKELLTNHLNDQGYFVTGDLGKWENGRLILLGRKDRMFFSAGENIQPEEIEKALMNIPGVLQAAIVPAPDPEYGARPVAFIDADLPAAEIQISLRQTLPGIKIPRSFYRLEPGLKPRLLELRRLLETGHAVPHD